MEPLEIREIRIQRPNKDAERQLATVQPAAHSAAAVIDNGKEAEMSKLLVTSWDWRNQSNERTIREIRKGNIKRRVKEFEKMAQN